MIGQFEPLIRCNRDGCDALVEPHVGRCGNHRGKHGAIPRRFPSGAPSPKTSITIGQVPHEASWVVAVVRGWLDGEAP